MPNINALLINKTTNVYYSSIVVTLWVCQSDHCVRFHLQKCDISHLPPLVSLPYVSVFMLCDANVVLPFVLDEHQNKGQPQPSVTLPQSYVYQEDSCQSSQFTKWISASRGVLSYILLRRLTVHHIFLVFSQPSLLMSG